MTKNKTQTQTADRTANVPPIQFEEGVEGHSLTCAEVSSADATSMHAETTEQEPAAQPKRRSYDRDKKLFDRLDALGKDAVEDDVKVAIDSLEAGVGYSSLMRQLHQAFVRRVAYYRSKIGGELSVSEARERAFHAPADEGEARELFSEMLRMPMECLNFIDLHELQAIAPRLAEGLWEMVKDEGRKEFESGHLAANITFPVGYMKEVWSIARYLGVRESFIAEWQPRGGIELSLIDMLAQSYFQWQYWLEQTVKRSQTAERTTHPDYLAWMNHRQEQNRNMGYIEGHWFSPTLSEQQALEAAVQMADRWNRIYMRTLRQLRDLRRYVPVTIMNPNHVNIATDGGQQINQT